MVSRDQIVECYKPLTLAITLAVLLVHVTLHEFEYVRLISANYSKSQWRID
jgi:hypothetical protein